MVPDVKDQEGGCDASHSRRALASSDVAASPASPSQPHGQKCVKEQEQPHLSRRRTKSKIKSSSRRMFTDEDSSDEDETAIKGKTGVRGVADEAENEGTDHPVQESDSPAISQSAASENSWMCPLSLDEAPPSPSDAETEKSSDMLPYSQSSGARVEARSCSGMILKLRRMLSKGQNGKRARYKAWSEARACDDSSPPQAEDEGALLNQGDLRWTPKAKHRLRRKGGFSHASLRSSSKNKHGSLLKIKYCPYLSACHSAEHRRRWVLRSAVQRARGAMRLYYPDLVGKRIRHLYEEDDKSEVWYRGEVLRVHEAHSNPLQTIFEVRYDSEPEWKYYLELLIDYKKGWLKIED